MSKFRSVLVISLFTLAASAFALGQTADPGVTANGVIGEVVAVDANSRQIFVKTDAGSVVIVAVADSTAFKKLPPGETTLTSAADIAFSDVSAGDRVFARGKPADDLKSLAAPRMVIVMTKGDLARKSEAEREEWRRRGVAGVVTALNPATKEITIQPFGGRPAGPPPGAAAGGQGAQAGGAPAAPAPVVIAAAGERVMFRRYAPNSVKFSDAKQSTFDELQVGDQVRAKGDRGEDGARFTPEEVVSGSFRTVVGTVKEVSPASREISIVTLEGNMPMTVVVSQDSELRQVPAEFGQMMMRGPGAGQGGGQATAQRGGAGGPGGAPGEGGPRRMGGGIQEMLERLPAAKVEDVRPGTMIVFSTTGADSEKATAIQLIAGIDPLVQMMQARAAAQNRPLNLGSFNLGIGQP